MSTLLAHLMELVASPKAITSHVEAVYSRKCVNFILRATMGRMIGEKAQAAACKEITQLIIKQMNTVGKFLMFSYIVLKISVFSCHFQCFEKSRKSVLIYTLK